MLYYLKFKAIKKLGVLFPPYIFMSLDGTKGFGNACMWRGVNHIVRERIM